MNRYFHSRAEVYLVRGFVEPILNFTQENLNMATKKTPSTPKTTRSPKSKAAVETPAPNSTVAPVTAQVKPSVQVAAADSQPESRSQSAVGKTPAAKPEMTSKPQTASKTEVTSRPEASKPEASQSASTGKIFGVRKAEARQNVVPINIEDEIRRRAYELSQQRDPHSGSEAEDWFKAEREIMQRYQQQSA
jgi:hypothetical protein